MNSHAYRRPELQRKVLTHLHACVAEGDHYFKSRRMAKLDAFAEYDARDIGQALASLERADDHEFEFERFSEAPCITWRVCRPAEDSVAESELNSG